ncbi:MAG: restriction endonuclease [Candidatus Bathyarchaeia archaeon]|nr:restriction endonuclease [Candidatus Bathyarchaeota archaeon]
MARKSLIDLTVEYFMRRGYDVKTNQAQVDDDNFSDFDLVVSKRKEIHPVRVKDWNRTVGVNIVINIDKASQRAGFSNPILVAEKFSEHAKAYANRRGIMLLSRFEILRSLM